MAVPNVLNPHPPEFDRFLGTSVGNDRNGFSVTVLSTLARLGLDPWNETADLVKLGHDGARARLGTLLARFQDVPSLASEHGKVAQDLSRLLPEEPATGARVQAGGRAGTSEAIWAVLAILFVLFQMFMVGGAGSGE